MIAISLLVKTTVLLAIAGAVQVVFGRRMSAAARHLTWALALGGVLLLPLLSVLLPAWPAVRVLTATAPAAAVLRSSERMSPLLDSNDHGPSVRSEPPFSSSSATPSRSVIDSPMVPWFAYGAGVVLLAIRLISEHLSLRRHVGSAREVTDPEWTALMRECADRVGVPRPVRLFRSVDETMPMTIGTLHAIIVIPAFADTWSADRRRAVLLHELAHVARHDCLTQTLAAAACALYWIHPAVWLAARRMRVERELACDDQVLSTGADARDYAGHLLELAYALRANRTPSLAVAMASPRQLEGRLLAMVDTARNRARPALRGRLTGLVIAAALIVTTAATTFAVVPADASHERSLLRDDPLAPAPSRHAEQAPGASSLAARAPGTWELRPTDETGRVHLSFREANGFSGFTIDVERLSGLPPGLLQGAGGPAQFSLRRDAGTFTFDGVVRNGIGAGTYSFTPDLRFASALAERGLSRPSPAELRDLAVADIGLAYLDELNDQGYTRPTLALLGRAGQHGVSLAYVREMGQLGYRLGRVESLIELRDHGVSPQYIRGLASYGLARLSADDLVRARDHGVSPEYARDLERLGYGALSLDALIRLRDHGVSAGYVQDLAQLGYRGLSLERMIELRGHGVSPQYVSQLRSLGYSGLDLDMLIRLRDNGVSPEYVRELAELGHRNLPLDRLIELRNNGVSPEYARGLGDLGYAKLPLDALIRLRNHGVSAEYVRALKDLGYDGLRVEDLVSLRNHGVAPGEIRRVNDRAGRRLTVDELNDAAARGWR